MAKLTNSQKNSLRFQAMQRLMSLLAEAGEDVMQTKNNKFMYPSVTDDGEELYFEITVSIPSGSRDGDQYNGYDEAENFRIVSQAKAEEKARKELEKQKKIERDKARRAEKE